MYFSCLIDSPAPRLSPGIGTPFTHIPKPAGTSGFEALPLVEWVGLALSILMKRVVFAWLIADGDMHLEIE